MIALAMFLVLLISSGTVTTAPGTSSNVPQGYSVANLDPFFNSTHNNQIYDPNFLPGFEAGLTNTHVSWSSGNGYGNLSYSIGPWNSEEGTGIPHFAVGPQCCNFVEVPHTQQFRKVDWGDYYYVRAGLGSPGINTENYTAVYGGPTTYVGLRTDWDWKVRISLKWENATTMNLANEWGAIGIDTTQVDPAAPGQLVYTLVNFWMDSNSSQVFDSSSKAGRWVAGPNLVIYHPMQMAGEGNETITVDISPYLTDTLQALNLNPSQNQPPLITYVYLNVEGYNFSWNNTLWSFELLTPTPSSSTVFLYATGIGAAVGITASLVLYQLLKRRSAAQSNTNPEQSQ